MGPLNPLNRRGFLSMVGACAAGAEVCDSSEQDACCQTVGESSGVLPAPNPRDIKANIKLVGAYMVHRGVWEGPCRWDPNPPPEQEKANFHRQFDSTLARLRKELRPYAQLMDPLYMEYDEREGFGQQELSRLAADHEEVDLYYVIGNVYPQYPATLIGGQYKKPIAFVDSLVNSDMAASLRARKLEGYAPLDFEELNHIIAALRARKIFRGMRVLVVGDKPTEQPRPSRSAMWDFGELQNRLGVEARFVNYQTFGDELNRVQSDPQALAEVKATAARLIRNATGVYIDEKYVINSIAFTQTVKNLMAKYGCNAHTIDCYEFCSGRKGEDWKVVPCMCHSLLKDEGYASACESDINALLAMTLLMSLGQRSAYMGNLLRVDDATARIFHVVPGMKMLGFDQPDLPYQLRNFTRSGWGTKVEIDFSKIEEKQVTFARFDPTARRFLLARGEVVGVEGFGVYGCTLGCHIRVPDAKALMRMRADYGYHFAMVYGDWAAEARQFAGMTGLEMQTYNV